MLWSVTKIILFVLATIALTFGAATLLETSGGIRVAVGAREFNLDPLQSVIAFLLLLVAFWLFLKLAGFLSAMFRFLNGDETAISRWFDRNRERKGYRALSDSLLALASGEGREAMHQATRAERLLARPELTNLLTAQAAEMAGDQRRAETAYKQLLSDDTTRFVGVRGIMKQRLADGDTDTALKLAEKAFSLKPKHTETQDVLLRLQAEKSDWTGARKTLEAKVKAGSLPRDIYRRRDAVLALSEARGLIEDGPKIKAQEESIEANRLSPDLVPAAVMAARAHIEQDKLRYAARVLKKAWAAQPHPELAAAFAEIAPEETPDARIKRFRTLTKANADHPETKMLLAELNIAAEDFPAARRALGDLPTDAPSARALTLMAAIERGEGADDTIVRGWLARALTASRGPQWVCDNCQSIHATWSPTCDNCAAFDTLAWREAAEGEVSMPGSAEMLPLIVGKPEPEELPVETEVVDAEEVVEAKSADEAAEVQKTV